MQIFAEDASKTRRGGDMAADVTGAETGLVFLTHYLELRAAAWRAGARKAEALAALLHADVDWQGAQPFNACQGRDAVRARFWGPLFEASPHLECRADLLRAGRWKGSDWVASTGHYVGLFTQDWLGLPVRDRLVSIRFGEFVRLSGGLVAEAYVLVDLLDVCRQLGVWPLAPALGNVERVPGPATHDGVSDGMSDDAVSQTSLALVESMIAGLMRYDGQTLESMAQERYWDTQQMMWYGPAGIGSARGLAHYQRVHQIPFLTAFPDRVGGHHKCRIAEGAYVASTGWPSVRATHRGDGFLGLPATGRPVGMRVMDFWRCADGRIHENWVLIDLPDLLLQMGVDVLARAGVAEVRAGG
jgi:predicted ester cyclase